MTSLARRFAVMAAILCACLACTLSATAFADEAEPETDEAIAIEYATEPEAEDVADIGEEAFEAEQAAEAITVAEEPDTDVEWATSTWARLYGNTALDTMARISSHGWKTSDVVIVTNADSYWDALAASSLAGKYQAPVLFTSPSALSAQTKTEITRLGATHAILVGGTSALPNKIANEVKALLKGQKRIDRPWGSDAPNTAVMVADELGEAMSNTCIIATSNGYWDALSASPYAYATGSPVYLTNPDGAISELVLAAIEREQFSRALIVGGTKAVSANTEATLAAIGIGEVKRFAGDDAYHTSKLFATWELTQGMVANRMGVATASGHWDALAGSALCGKNKAVLVLADDGATGNASIAKANKAQISRGYIFGGPAAVGNKALQAFANAA